MAAVPGLFQITGTCNNYAWGKKGRDSLAARLREKTTRVDFAIQDDEYYSELWFGDYPDFPGREVQDGRLLADVIAANKEKLLGAHSLQKFGDHLPFLPKVLSIAKALPLQIHPNKALAAKLHGEDPSKFSDANHKPEIAVALSRFELFAGWKPLDQISPLFNAPSLRPFVPDDTAATAWTDDTLRSVVRGLLKADERTVQAIEEELKQQPDEEYQRLGFPGSMSDLIGRLQAQYSQQDPGLLVAVLCMNFLVLQPGDGIFIPTDGVHAYVSGDIIECMARSNNMLAGGLCPSPDRDDADLFADTLLLDKDSTSVEKLRLPRKPAGDGSRGHTTVYQPPIGEFDVLRVDLRAGEEELLRAPKGPMVAIVVSGAGSITGDSQELDAREGFIFFVGAGTATALRAREPMQVFAAAVRE
ncbi:hexose-6-phosphate isomerase [Moelleriella libera RCEF 2490]|uniref:Mannose-6-phosphate isomerase n=1 Tax=Moelleriella libera RCEF 2490 TaxID=1081109 RepID=A0A166UBV4_9HYPO|nr:hexose-6-phosphate isomerase [Moelleriella libera RCEF 2490]